MGQGCSSNKSTDPTEGSGTQAPTVAPTKAAPKKGAGKGSGHPGTSGVAHLGADIPLDPVTKQGAASAHSQVF